MTLYLRELSMLFLLGCWNDAPPKQHPRDASADSGDANVVDPEEAGIEEAEPEGRERGLAGGLRDASADRAVSTGALCGVNGRDDCGPFQACDTSLGCVECTSDDDCPLAAKKCVRGACVECEVGADCPASAPSCWPKDHACHARCTDDCPTTEHICTAGECWGCAGDADCPPRGLGREPGAPAEGGAPASGRCSPFLRQCVTCLEDADCPLAAPRCDVRRGTCVQCDSNDDCGRAAPVCDPATRTCRVGCWSDAQCPGKRCDPATADCATTPEDGGANATDAGKD